MKVVRKLGEYSLQGIRDARLPGHQVDIGAAWVGNDFYARHRRENKVEIDRDDFIEITRHDGNKTRNIVRVVRALPGNQNLPSGVIGLQYNCQKRLKAQEGDILEVHRVDRLRGTLIYLWSHPSPLIVYQFWLTMALFGLGVFFSLIFAVPWR